MCDSPSRVILGGGIFFLNVQSLRVSTEPILKIFKRETQNTSHKKRKSGFALVELDDIDDTIGFHSSTVDKQLIAQFADRIRRKLPPKSFLGRLGDFKFLIIVPDTKEKQFQKVCTKLRYDILNRRFALKLHSESNAQSEKLRKVSTTCSIGAVWCNNLAKSKQDTIFNELKSLLESSISEGGNEITLGIYQQTNFTIQGEGKSKRSKAS